LGVVVFLVGPTAGKLNLLGLAVAIEMVVDELRAVVRIDALERKGQGLTHLIEGTARVSVHVAGISVRLSDWHKSPEAEKPEWVTRSISVNPGC
jgi:hypothetical protein